MKGDKNTIGEITVYTELKPCTGCVQSRVDFQNKYPKIDITFVDKKGGVDFDIKKLEDEENT